MKCLRNGNIILQIVTKELILMADFSQDKCLKPSLSTNNNGNGTDDMHRNRNKSVQWADWEMKEVVEFKSQNISEAPIDEYTQTDIDLYEDDSRLPLINGLVQTSVEISSIASQSSRNGSISTYSTVEEDEAQQAAMLDLITHLEDTAALLREYLLPPKPEDIDGELNSSFQQTTFLLKYQIVLVVFTQLVSILILSLFDHMMEKEKDIGYQYLTVACGTTLQIVNMLLVLFATAVLSRQMLKYKVEGPLMAQTYLATVITFAGLYFIIYRIRPSSWEFGGTDKIENNIAIGQFIQFLYLSVSAATLCGAANIQPNGWYVTLILCFQSLINFVYFASILAQTIGNYHSYTVQVRRSSSMSRLRNK